MILKHRKHSRREAKFQLTSLLFMNALVLPFIYGFTQKAWGENFSSFDDFLFIPMAIGSFLIANVFGALVAIRNMKLNEEFVCEIDETEIRCRCPRVGFDSDSLNFVVAISDIVTIERREWESGSDWYIHDKAGKRYMITQNYGNPSSEFVAIIKERNSSITEITT